jgi:uncharacterized protein with PhoU and TrkA domain
MYDQRQIAEEIAKLRNRLRELDIRVTRVEDDLRTKSAALRGLENKVERM